MKRVLCLELVKYMTSPPPTPLGEKRGEKVMQLNKPNNLCPNINSTVLHHIHFLGHQPSVVVLRHCRTVFKPGSLSMQNRDLTNV